MLKKEKEDHVKYVQVKKQISAGHLCPTAQSTPIVLLSEHKVRAILSTFE